MSTHFAIVSMGRTGSTLLVGLLNSHPDIECKGELFGPHAAYTKFPALTRKEFLERHAYDSKLPIKGFKMPFDWILNHPGIFDDFRDLGYKIVRLKRTNGLAHLVSVRLAQRNNNWGSREPYGIERTKVDKAALYRFLQYRDSSEAMLDRVTALLTGKTFNYETILDCNEQQRLLSFLGARPHALKPDTIKQRKLPLAETIENLTELRQALSGTPRARHS